MNDLRLLLVDMNPLLEEIVSEFTGSVLGVASRQNLEKRIQQTGANVVLLGLEETELPEVCTDFYKAFPDVGLVALASDGERTILHLPNMGPRELLAALRASNYSLSGSGLRGEGNGQGIREGAR